LITEAYRDILKVSVLFNEPKLLKFTAPAITGKCASSFSALQRAEIAEIQRARRSRGISARFSALQRAEIAEIRMSDGTIDWFPIVSVLFNEPKLLK